MAVALTQIITEDRASGGQVIDGSLKFDRARSTYLERTMTSSGNGRQWTVSFWYKWNYGSSTSNDTHDFFACPNGGTAFYTYSGSGDAHGRLYWANHTTGTPYNRSDDRFRDHNAWYHVVVVADMDQGSAQDQQKIYINGVRIGTNSPQNPPAGVAHTWNTNVVHRIATGTTEYWPGYMCQWYGIDGQTLGPEYFGFTDPLTNTWRPKKYTGTYGTNGFYLPMDGNSPIGEDKSGNGNDWTPVNFGGSAAIDKADTLPVIKTTGGGKVATVGSATDSLSANLKVAYSYAGSSIDSAPTSITTFAANGATFTKGVDGGPSFYTDVAPLYMTKRGSQYDYPRASFSAGAFNFMHNQTGSGTMECWFYNGSFSGEATIMSDQSGSGDVGIALNMVSATTCQIDLAKGTSGSTYNSGTATLPQNEWTHLAVTKSVSGSTCSIKLYLNGVLKASNNTIDATTLSNSNSTSAFWQHGPTINNEDPAFNRGWITAYIKDFRVYDTVKYTKNFIVGSVNPDILPDTPSGVAGGSALTKITDGAVYFDGTGDYLSVADNTDFELGSGDFTIEAFALLKAVPGSNGDTIVGQSGSNTNNRGWQLTIRDTANSVTNPVKLLYSTNGTAWANASGSNGTSTSRIYTNRWYHFAVTRSGDTWYLFVNGNQENSWTDSNSIFNTTADLEIGSTSALTEAANAFISNVRVIKGTALYTASFTPPTAPLTNVTNTKLLCCQSPSSATAAAVSPGSITANGNAAASNFNPFTTDIDAVRGQESGWCTLNPLNTGAAYTLSNGNLEFTSTTNWDGSTGTFVVSSGKWYYEFTRGTGTSGLLGWCEPQNYVVTNEPGDPANSSVWRYRDDGTKRNGEAGGQSYGATWTTAGDVIGCALDLDVGTIAFYKNGISQGIAYSNLSGKTLAPVIGFYNCTAASSVNFGQKPFKFPPPEGFKTLCLANLPRPTEIALKPDKYFKTILYTGDQNGQTIDVGFEPSLIWGKQRNDTDRWFIADTVRGKKTTGYYLLSSHLTATDTSSAAPDGITDISSTGFTLGANSSNDDGGWSIEINQTGGSYLAHCWKRSIEAGFDIVTHTNTNDSTVINHNLGKTPEFIITKCRTASTTQWRAHHVSGGVSQTLILSTTEAYVSTAERVTAVSDTTFTYNATVTANGNDFIHYVWTSVPGFSKFGSYTGNGSTNGPFIHLGFKPAWLLLKRTDSTSSWFMLDTKRDTYNVSDTYLIADGSQAEATYTSVDFLSNGFKPRNSSSSFNTDGATHVYAAFAEAPTFNLFGGQANAR